MFVVHLDNNNNNDAKGERGRGERAKSYFEHLTIQLNATHDIDMKRTQILIASFITIKAYAA